MIVVTEIGDKTFFIAAVLAMKNGRILVYTGAMAALTAMHLLSSLMGYALPALLSRKYTNIASTVCIIEKIFYLPYFTFYFYFYF